MADHKTVTVQDTYVQLNTSAASGALSIYPLDSPVWLAPSASTTAPTSEAGAILIGPTSQGSGVINQTLAQLWPGFTSPAYVFARVASGGAIGARVAVSIA